MHIKTVGVLGCGLMGAGIAQVAASTGFKTIVREVNQTLLDKGMTRIRKFLDAGVEKGKLTPAQRDATLANVSGTTKLSDLHDCDLVIEAIIEHVTDKAAAYSALEAA